EQDEPVAGELQGDGADRKRPEVDDHRPAALTEQGGELVEQTGLRPDPAVFDHTAKLRELDAIGLELPGQGAERQAERDGECGRRGEAGPPWHRATDLETGAAQLAPRSLQLGRGASHKCAPSLRRSDIGEVEAVGFLEIA